MATHKKQKTKQSQRLIKVLKITGYSLAWLIIWSTVAFGMALVSLMIAIPTIDQTNFTSRSASNLVLTIILVIAAVFFLAVWLLRKRKSLFMRTSWVVLLVCTCLGLLVGVPISLMGKWEPDTPLQQSVQQSPTDSTTPIDTESQQNQSPNTTNTNGSGSGTQATPSQTSSSNPQAGCKYYDDIPYTTEEKTDSNLKEGQTREISGHNGTRKVCTDASGSVVSSETTNTPINKIIYYGTFTYEQAQAKAKDICNASLPAGTPRNSTFYWDCVDKELKKLW